MQLPTQKLQLLVLILSACACKLIYLKHNQIATMQLRAALHFQLGC